MHDTHGHIYIYLIYGMYHCINFTTSKKAGAVLIRAVEPLEGIKKMQKRRIKIKKLIFAQVLENYVKH